VSDEANDINAGRGNETNVVAFMMAVAYYCGGDNA
jgi:hypothetical protein